MDESQLTCTACNIRENWLMVRQSLSKQCLFDTLQGLYLGLRDEAVSKAVACLYGCTMSTDGADFDLKSNVPHRHRIQIRGGFEGSRPEGEAA